MKLGCFSEADLDRIREAVTEAERRTSAEIVTYIVRDCGEYREVAWKGALLGTLLLGGLVAVGDAALQSWGGPHPVLWWTALLIGALGGYMLASAIPGARRWAVPNAVLAARVQDRAEAAFLEEQVFATRARSGILLFVALFERRAVVIGDRAIHEAVESVAWERIVETVVRGMESGRPTGGLIDAVAQCGELLAESGLPQAADDLDELDDTPRVHDR